MHPPTSTSQQQRQCAHELVIDRAQLVEISLGKKISVKCTKCDQYLQVDACRPDER